MATSVSYRAKSSSLAVLFAFLAIIPGANGQPVVTQPSAQPGSGDSWRFSVTPYAWALGLRGSVSHDNSRIGQVRLSPSDVLSDLRFTGMVAAQASYGRLGLYLDAMYGELGQTNSTVVRQASLSAKTSTTITMVTLAPVYRLYESPSFYMDGLAGVRFLQQRAQTTVSGPLPGGALTVSAVQNLTDVVVGVKGRWKLGDSRYFVPFYVDVGAGERSSVTTQAYLGLGHTFDWGDLSLVVKNVFYQYRQNSNTLDLNMLGIAAGVTFRF